MNYNLKNLSLLLTFLLIHIFVSAQESKSTINVEGKDFNKLKHAWTAQWITHPTESTLDSVGCVIQQNLM